MKTSKKIIAFLLACVLWVSFSLTAFAQKEVNKVEYYSMDIEQVYQDGSSMKHNINVMIYPTKNELYIRAEDLRILSMYEFNLSEQDCTFTNIERNHLVYFKFNTKEAVVCQAGNRSNYKMPYAARYVDEVAWIPMDFGFKILNMQYIISNKGLTCCCPYDTVFSVANRILTRNYEFNYAKELGYSELAMFGLESSAFVTNLFSGLLDAEGSCWATLLTSMVGSKLPYDEMIATEVCNLFVMPVQNELYDEFKWLYQFPVTKENIGDGIDDITELLDEIDAANSKMPTNQILSNSIKKISKNVKEVTDDLKISISKSDYPVGILDLYTHITDLVVFYMEFSNRDEFASRALKEYGKESELNVARAVRSYANDAIDKDDASAALDRYFKENWDNIVLGTIPLGGPATIALIGWNMLSETFPFYKDGLDNTKSFAISQQATMMQNDAYRICEEDYIDVFHKKKLDQDSLEKMSTDCYTYLKFSIIARDSAIKSIEKSTKIKQEVKENAIKRLEDKNASLGEQISIITKTEEGSSFKVNNENGVYGLLLPSTCSSYCRELDDTYAINLISNTLGTLISTSTQELEPVELVLITEEEAIEMVRKALNKYSMGMFDKMYKDFYRFECIELCDVYVIDLESEEVFEGTEEFDTDYCYVICSYVNESPDALFCVSADGTGAYLCEVYDENEYGYMEAFNLNDLNIKDLFDVMMQVYKILFRSMGAENAQTNEVIAE